MNIKNKVLYDEIRKLSGYSLDLETLCLRVSGDDASKFLQGQLSNDINLIDDNNYQVSSYSTNQGKVISINRIFKDNHSYIILLNKDIAEYFVEKISMYILMSKVDLKIEKDYKVFGLIGKNAKKLSHENNIIGDRKYLKKDNLWIMNTMNKDIYSNIIICEKDSEDFFRKLNVDELDFNVSKFIDIISCFLRINKLNKERYIPQVLNLDENNGINFKKGCYTGQEIIARTHYLGKVKKKIFIIKHTSSKIDINDKIYNENDESVGEVISNNIILNNEYYCLGVIKIDSTKSSIFSKKENLSILN
jgi:folate-binding protein YgfZ